MGKLTGGEGGCISPDLHRMGASVENWNQQKELGRTVLEALKG